MPKRFRDGCQSSVLLIAVALLASAQSAFAATLTLPATTLTLASPQIQGSAGYTLLASGNTTSSLWQAASPIYVQFSEITFQFSDETPEVTVSPFTIDMGTVSVTASLPFGISSSVQVGASKSPGLGIFSGGTRQLAYLSDGSFRLDFSGQDISQTTFFSTPVGSTTSGGSAPWTFRFLVSNATPSSASLFIEFVGTGGDSGGAIGQVGGESVEFHLQGPASIINVVGLALVPEPSVMLLVVLGCAAVSARRLSVSVG